MNTPYITNNQNVFGSKKIIKMLISKHYDIFKKSNNKLSVIKFKNNVKQKKCKNNELKLIFSTWNHSLSQGSGLQFNFYNQQARARPWN